MKTRTIFDAWQKASARNYYLSTAVDFYPRLEKRHRRVTRQKNKFHAALLSRIEAGDRAREALRFNYDEAWHKIGLTESAMDDARYMRDVVDKIAAEMKQPFTSPWMFYDDISKILREYYGQEEPQP
jgi:hypothetical protein